MRFLLNLFGYEFGLGSGLDFYFLILLCLVLQWRHWWESAYNIYKIQHKQDGVKGKEWMEGMVSQAPSCWVDCWIWRLDLSYGERGRSPGPGLCARPVPFSLHPFPFWCFFTIFSVLAISFVFYLPPFLSHPFLFFVVVVVVFFLVLVFGVQKDSKNKAMKLKMKKKIKNWMIWCGLPSCECLPPWAFFFLLL